VRVDVCVRVCVSPARASPPNMLVVGVGGDARATNMLVVLSEAWCRSFACVPSPPISPWRTPSALTVTVTVRHAKVICGALPRPKLVPKLKEEGVTHVVNMVAEYGGPVKDYKTAGITQGLHSPSKRSKRLLLCKYASSKPCGSTVEEA